MELGTTSANRMLAATNLTGLSVVYATVGTKTVVLRVFKAGNCPAGLTPSSFAEPEAVGITYIQVRGRSIFIQRLMRDSRCVDLVVCHWVPL